MSTYHYVNFSPLLYDGSLNLSLQSSSAVTVRTLWLMGREGKKYGV